MQRIRPAGHTDETIILEGKGAARVGANLCHAMPTLHLMYEVLGPKHPHKVRLYYWLPMDDRHRQSNQAMMMYALATEGIMLLFDGDEYGRANWSAAYTLDSDAETEESKEAGSEA
jgi:hypothetical protein